MRRCIVWLLMLLPATVVAQQVVPDSSASKVAANSYVIHGPLETPNPQNRGFMNNPGFVITKEGVVVIDPGSSLYIGQMVLRQIKKITDKPVTHVLNTHIHGDHWLGNQAFTEAYPNAILMAHPRMITEAKAGADQQWLDMMERLTKGATKGTRAVIPDHKIDDAFVLKTGSMTFKMLAPADAHSGSDVMIHVVEESLVFMGDNVFFGRIGRMDDGSFRGNVAACDIAIKLGANTYVPGHGTAGTVNVVKRFRNYLKTLYDEVALLYEQGLSDFEMKPKVVAKLKGWQNWAGFSDQVGKHISLALLEYEKAQFE